MEKINVCHPEGNRHAPQVAVNDARQIESWGLRLLDKWGYFDRHESRLGVSNLLHYIPLWQPAWVEDNLERISTPTLVIWGEKDTWHSLAMAFEFRQRIRGARVETLPACGHLPHEERPHDFNRLAIEFLACHLGGSTHYDKR